MGWSCGAEANKVVQAWAQACIESTGAQNTWKDAKGVEYFWELARTEHADGAITGTVWRFLTTGPNTQSAARYAKRSGSFCIEGDGAVTRAPKFLKGASHV